MENNNTIPKCPPLRFPEFTDEWKQTTLGESYPLTMGQSPSSLFYNTNQKGLPLIQGAADMQGGRTIIRFYSLEGSKSAQQGDIILSVRAPVGRVVLTDFDCFIGRGVCAISSRNKYPFYFLQSYEKSWSKLASGSTFDSITGKEVSTLPISLPSLLEQQKIATFLSLLDERIEAQRQIIKERKAEKKALLHQLFSQSIRFPGFSDEWKQTTLGRICKVSTGEMNTQDKVEDGKYPFYVRSSKIERANRYTYDGISILTPGDGAIGQIFHYSEGKIAVHQRVYMLTEMQCIPKYLFHYFSARFFERVSRMSAKNTVDSVRMNMITDMPISLPSLSEQKKIAELFTILDERIEVEEALLASYETQKRYLLQQMFI